MWDVTQKLGRAKKGQASSGLTNAVIAIVVVGALIYVGLLVNNKFDANIDRTDFSAAENTTFNEISTNVNDGFSLIGTGMVILALVVIIGIVLLLRNAG